MLTNAVAQKTPAEQPQYHANHPCAVEVDSNFQHVGHAGPHSLAPGDDVKKFLTRLRRHSQRAREAKDKKLLGLGNCIANPVTKLKFATENLTFDAATKDPNFNVHTIYLVPGSLMQESDNGLDQPKLCLMFTSFNLILNVARAVHWYRNKGGAIAGIDHTFKVRCTCAICKHIVQCACALHVERT